MTGESTAKSSSKSIFASHNWSLCTGILIVLMALFCKLPYWFAHPLLIHADQSVYLAMADMFLQGKKPYVDFFDFNPPLIIYLSTIPIALSKMVPLTPIQIFNLTINFLMLISTALSGALFYANRNSTDRFLYFPLLLAPIICTQTQFYDFGQREHLFVLLYFPFFVCRLLRYRSGQIQPILSVLVGIFAAVGVSLKPQFLLTAMLLEATLMWQWRTLKLANSLENKICALLTVLYLAHFAFLGQAALDILLQQAWPIYTTGLSYFHIGFIEGLASLSNFSYPYYLLALALSLAFACKGKSPWLEPAVALTIISWLSLLQAGSIWTYRGIPMQLGCWILIALATGIGIEFLFTHKPKIQVSLLSIFLCLPLVGAVGICLCAFPLYKDAGAKQFDLAQIGYRGKSPLNDLSPLVPSIIANSKIDDKVIYLGRGVRPGYPSILQAHRNSGSRYLHGMILPMLLVCIEKNPTRYTPMLDKVIANYGDDILANKPKLIFIDDSFVAPLFAQHQFVQKYMTNYELVERVEQAQCTLYRSK